jgi:hypothetical protein
VAAVVRMSTGAHLRHSWRRSYIPRILIPGGTASRVTINDQDLMLTMQHEAPMLLWAVETYIARTTTEAPPQ